MRVEIPAYTDRWMMGDRYGEVMRITRSKKSDNELGHSGDIYVIKLDKSGRTYKCWADDCREV